MNIEIPNHYLFDYQSNQIFKILSEFVDIFNPFYGQKNSQLDH